MIGFDCSDANHLYDGSHASHRHHHHHHHGPLRFASLHDHHQLYDATPSVSPAASFDGSGNGITAFDSFPASFALSPPTARARSLTARMAAHIDDYFEITARGSSIVTEIRAGVVTFATMAYILIVNAEILSRAKAPTDAEPMRVDGIITATAISAAVGSGMAGMLANLPIGLAAGMGLNSAFTYNVVLQSGLSWRIALTCVFVHGLLFTLLALTGLCNLLQRHAPQSIKKSITVGLGLFQALIGFESMQLIVQGQQVLLSIGDLQSPQLWLSLFGLALITVLLQWNIKASMLIGMIVITTIGWVSGLEPWPQGIVTMPSLGNTFVALDFPGFFSHWRATLPIVAMFLFVSVSDTAGVQLMAGEQAELVDEHGHLPGSSAAFLSAGIATCVGALFGCSPVIIHTESCAGIADGARTGLHSVTVAALFVLSLPFAPLLAGVPSLVTAPVLVIVGVFMMAVATYINWQSIDQAIPAFLTATLLPFSYSIANGVSAGLLAFVVLQCAKRLDPFKRADGGRDSALRGISNEEQQPLTQSPYQSAAASMLSPSSPSLLPLFVPLNGRSHERLRVSQQSRLEQSDYGAVGSSSAAGSHSDTHF